MLRFFRQIRKKLIAQKKVRTYLLYAIGEILLVVIGILIALQVNNWNQGRLDYQKSIDYHQRLLSDLNVTINLFRSDSARADEVMRNIMRSVEILESGVLTDSSKVTLDYTLNNFFQFTRLTPELTSYEEMKSTGQLGLIYNNDLREEISNYLTRKKAIAKIYDQLADKVDETEFIDIYVKVAPDEENPMTYLEYDFYSLSSDLLVINTLSRYSHHWRTKKIFSSALLSNARELKDAINNELKEMK